MLKISATLFKAYDRADAVAQACQNEDTYWTYRAVALGTKYAVLVTDEDGIPLGLL